MPRTATIEAIIAAIRIIITLGMATVAIAIRVTMPTGI
jgi:hypothetical protein